MTTAGNTATGKVTTQAALKALAEKHLGGSMKAKKTDDTALLHSSNSIINIDVKNSAVGATPASTQTATSNVAVRQVQSWPMDATSTRAHRHVSFGAESGDVVLPLSEAHTYGKKEYKRGSPSLAKRFPLSYGERERIRREIVQYKLKEMVVHPDSRDSLDLHVGRKKRDLQSINRQLGFSC